MSFKRKGQLTKSPERHKHLGDFLSRMFWKKERRAEKALIKKEMVEWDKEATYADTCEKSEN